MDIVIIHFNTQKLTDALISSVKMHIDKPFIYVFDNSDKTPFVNTHSNVQIIDNTKGQIIDFNEWLNSIKTKDERVGKVNNYGSAKHCLTIDKCIEILKRPFVLLDSDVLIKRNFSDICDESCIFSGEPSVTGYSKKRVLPYICYINAPMCLANNIHYFSAERMHGLNKGKVQNLYDTGASFYEDAKHLKHKIINHNKYVVHLKAGSWGSNRKEQISADEWLDKYKLLWETEEDEYQLIEDTNNSKVIYTCITNGYDALDEHPYICKGFDYVCFTDNPSLESKIWQIRPMPIETENIPSNKKQRFVKINPHIVLPEYETSVWVDGNIHVNGDINELLSNESIIIPQHPKRERIYEEMEACLHFKKDSMENMLPQITRYKKENFPPKYGMVQSNIIIRKHNNDDCKRLMNLWWEELSKGSHRDQLSFNYCLWRNEDIKIKLLDKLIYKSKWFTLSFHQNKNKPNGKYTQNPLKHGVTTAPKKIRVKRRVSF